MRRLLFNASAAAEIMYLSDPTSILAPTDCSGCSKVGPFSPARCSLCGVTRILWKTGQLPGTWRCAPRWLLNYRRSGKRRPELRDPIGLPNARPRRNGWSGRYYVCRFSSAASVLLCSCTSAAVGRGYLSTHTQGCKPMDPGQRGTRLCEATAVAWVGGEMFEHPI